MKEYIERESVINLIEENSETKFDWSECVDIDILRPAIKDIPAADVAPVIHGEWIHKNGEMYCSVCGSEALMDEVYYESPYCPDCGAKMDGGNK